MRVNTCQCATVTERTSEEPCSGSAHTTTLLINNSPHLRSIRSWFLMARQQGFKRARTRSKAHKNASDDESDSSVDRTNTHPVKKTVRWMKGTNEDGLDSQGVEDSDDESVGLQKVSSPCPSSSWSHLLAHYCYLYFRYVLRALVNSTRLVNYHNTFN
jgi:hypothetical protein